MITTNIICRYGVPHELISDHRSHFKDDTATLLEQYTSQHRQSSTYGLQTNGVVEVTIKNIKNILRKMVENYKDRPNKVPFALWRY